MPETGYNDGPLTDRCGIDIFIANQRVRIPSGSSISSRVFYLQLQSGPRGSRVSVNDKLSSGHIDGNEPELIAIKAD